MSGRVLIVDDMMESRNLLRILLAKKGKYTVLEAENGNDALHIAHNEPPDLVVLDYMMPDLDGAEVCQRLRANAATAQVPIIVVTARTDYQTRDKALGAGANVFMTKPLKPQELLAETKRLLDQTAALS